MSDVSARSLEEIEGDFWGDAAADASRLVATVHQLRHKPVGELGVEDLRVLLGQRVGVPVLVPRALDVLEHDPLAEGDMYPGDLLNAVLRRVPAEYWSAQVGEADRLRGIVAGVDLGEVDDDELKADIVELRRRAG